MIFLTDPAFGGRLGQLQVEHVATFSGMTSYPANRIIGALFASFILACSTGPRYLSPRSC